MSETTLIHRLNPKDMKKDTLKSEEVLKIQTPSKD